MSLTIDLLQRAAGILHGIDRPLTRLIKVLGRGQHRKD